MSNSVFRNYVMNFLVFISPTFFILQVIFPESIQPLILYFRLIVFPLIVTLIFPNSIHIKSIVMFIIYSILTTVARILFGVQDTILYIITIVDSVILFRWGALLASRYKNNPRWKLLINGLLLLNISTILVYVCIILGYLDITEVLKFLDAQTYYQGYSRFALGNSIEVPFIITALLSAIINISSDEESFFYSALFNFIAVAISESRIVLIIAFLLLVKEFIKISFRKRVIVVVIIISIFSQINIQDYVGPVYESIVQRFSGNDSGSQEHRLNIAKTFRDNISLRTFIVGDGIGSSDRLMLRQEGYVRTIESSLLQLFYDLGIFGSILVMMAALLDLQARPSLSSNTTPFISLISLQLLFFLPIHSGLPLTIFALSLYLYAPKKGAKQQQSL